MYGTDSKSSPCANKNPIELKRKNCEEIEKRDAEIKRLTELNEGNSVMAENQLQKDQNQVEVRSTTSEDGNVDYHEEDSTRVVNKHKSKQGVNQNFFDSGYQCRNLVKPTLKHITHKVEQTTYNPHQPLPIRLPFEHVPPKTPFLYNKEERLQRVDFERNVQERKTQEEIRRRRWEEEQRTLEESVQLQYLQNNPSFCQQSKETFNNFNFSMDKEYKSLKVIPIQQRTRFKPDKYLISRLKEYSGERGDNLQNFLYTLERYFINDQVPNDYQVIIASDHLTKHALEKFKMASRDNELTWPELKELLVENFQPADFQAALRRELSSLKHDKTRNVSDYIYEFEKLMNQITAMSELDKAFHFIEGLQAEVAKYVNYSGKGNTLYEAEKEALRVENIFSLDRNENKSKDNRGPKDRLCEDRNEAKENVNCTIQPSKSISQKVFSAITKQKSPKDQKINNKRQQENQLLDHRDRKDNKSVASGKSYVKEHHSSEIKKTGKQTQKNLKANKNDSENDFQATIVKQDNPLLKCPIVVKDLQFEAILDTGATKSIISTELVNKHNLPLNKNSNFAVTVANGEKVMAQLTKPLPVCLHNRICNMQFVALPNNNKDIIVGLDLITYFGLT